MLSYYASALSFSVNKTTTNRISPNRETYAESIFLQAPHRKAKPYATLPFVSSPRELVERSTYGRSSDLLRGSASSHLIGSDIVLNRCMEITAAGQRLTYTTFPLSFFAFLLGRKRTVVGIIISKSTAKVRKISHICKFFCKKHTRKCILYENTQKKRP